MPPRHPEPFSIPRLVAAGVAIALLGAIVAIATPGSADAGSPTGAGEGGVALSQIGSFDSPSYVASAPGFKRMLFVVELPGTISVLRNGKPRARPFLDISEQVQFQAEDGLFSVAFDPGYRKTRLFYVYYVDNSGDLRIDEFKRRRGSTTAASPGSQRNVLTIAHPFWSNHNGGQLQFGPDGELWLATGDGGGAGDIDDNARDLSVLLGKLLRIDPSVRKGAYGIPKDNPFVGRDGADEIWGYGLRNPWRFSFDSRSGNIAIGDVGQAEVEEVDFLSPAMARGANFGWPQFEGNQPFDLTRPGPDPPTAPIHTYSSAGGTGACSVTGGYVVHDPALPTLRNRYVYADLCAGQLRSFVPSVGGSSDDKPLGPTVASPTSFGEDSKGHIYVTSIEGPVYRLVPG
jgi:glucose/arabinose dehydrogenase